MFQMEVCHLVLLQQRQLLLQMLLQFMRGRARLDILFKRSQASIKASMIEASKPPSFLAVCGPQCTGV